MWICVRSKDAQEQLARMSLRMANCLKIAAETHRDFRVQNEFKRGFRVRRVFPHPISMVAHNCHGKIKFRTTNWNYFRQTTNIHGKNKNSRHYSEFLTANRSRQKQIAAKAKAVVSGIWSAVVQVRGVTRHDLHDLDSIYTTWTRLFLFLPWMFVVCRK